MTEPTQEAMAVLAMAFAAHDNHPDAVGGCEAAAHCIQAALNKREAETDARIVAWLKNQAVEKCDREWMGPLDIADAIERGEHKEPKQ